MMVWLALILATDGEGLTVEAASRRALEHSHAVHAIEHRRKEALAEGAVDTALENPQFRLQSLRTDRLLAPALQVQPTGDAPLGGTMFAIRWKPPNPMVNASRHREAAHRGDEMNALADVQRRSVVAQAQTLHATVLNLGQQLELARASNTLRSKLMMVGQGQLAEKGVRGVDAALAALEELEARALVLELEQNRRAAHLALAALVGLKEPPALQGPPRRCEGPKASVEALVERAVGHPAVQAYKARMAASEAERSQALTGLIPWFDYVQLGYTVGNEGNVPFGSFRMGVRFPLFNWGSAEVARADARKGRAEAEGALAAEELKVAIERAHRDAVEDAALVEQYRQAQEREVVPTQQRLVKALESAEVSLVDFAKVQARTLSAQRASLKLELHCLTSLIELEQLTQPLEREQ